MVASMPRGIVSTRLLFQSVSRKYARDTPRNDLIIFDAQRRAYLRVTIVR